MLPGFDTICVHPFVTYMHIIKNILSSGNICLLSFKKSLYVILKKVPSELVRQGRCCFPFCRCVSMLRTRARGHQGDYLGLGFAFGGHMVPVVRWERKGDASNPP